MFLFLKKKPEDGDDPEIRPGIPLHEFIPYHSHYDAHTLITRNGELMQTIRIAGDARGLNYQSGHAATVRAALRQAAMTSVQNDKLALWTHTIRRRKPIIAQSPPKEALAADVYEHWQKKHSWKYQYYNEIYLTVLHDGQSAALVDTKNLQRVALPRLNRQHRNAYLEDAYANLEATVSAIIEKIRLHYDARRLELVERAPPGMPQAAPIFYSEPMEFLGHLLRLHPESFPLSETDIGQAIAPNSLTFGFNALETRSADEQRRFAAMLTLKQYREVPPETADRVLQAPMEFIITEALRFVPATRALKSYKLQRELFEISGDEESIHTSGIDDMLRSDHSKPTDFAEHQISIMVMADEYKKLDEDAHEVQAAFADLGLVTIREDIKLEECYWSQLPENFAFDSRPNSINTARTSWMCRLNRLHEGSESGNHWGNAVMLLPTTVDSPYFFNFHHKDNGHTLLFDFNSFRDAAGQVLLNFLLTQTRQYSPRMYFFDRDASAQLFFEKLGGHYHPMPGPGMNPFTLEDTPRNRSFLMAWCGALSATPLSDAQKDLLRAGIDQLYAGPPEERHLRGLVGRITDAPLAKSFSPWLGKGKFSGLFDGPEAPLDFTGPLHAFDMTSVAAHAECVIPVFSYLMHSIIDGLDGTPTIIVLREAWDLLENPFFAPRLESLLEMLRQNNVMVIATASRPARCAETHIFPTLMRGCATHLYVPDDILIDYAAQHLGLSEQDIKLLRRMDRQKGDVLLKQNNESIGLRTDLGNFDDLRAIFAGDAKALAAAKGKFGGPLGK